MDFRKIYEVVHSGGRKASLTIQGGRRDGTPCGFEWSQWEIAEAGKIGNVRSREGMSIVQNSTEKTNTKYKS